MFPSFSSNRSIRAASNSFTWSAMGLTNVTPGSKDDAKPLSSSPFQKSTDWYKQRIEEEHEAKQNGNIGDVFLDHRTAKSTTLRALRSSLKDQNTSTSGSARSRRHGTPPRSSGLSTSFDNGKLRVDFDCLDLHNEEWGNLVTNSVLAEQEILLQPRFSSSLNLETLMLPKGRRKSGSLEDRPYPSNIHRSRARHPAFPSPFRSSLDSSIHSRNSSYMSFDTSSSADEAYSFTSISKLLEDAHPTITYAVNYGNARNPIRQGRRQQVSSSYLRSRESQNWRERAPRSSSLEGQHPLPSTPDATSGPTHTGRIPPTFPPGLLVLPGNYFGHRSIIYGGTSSIGGHEPNPLRTTHRPIDTPYEDSETLRQLRISDHERANAPGAKHPVHRIRHTRSDMSELANDLCQLKISERDTHASTQNPWDSRRVPQNAVPSVHVIERMLSKSLTKTLPEESSKPTKRLRTHSNCRIDVKLVSSKGSPLGVASHSGNQVYDALSCVKPAESRAIMASDSTEQCIRNFSRPIQNEGHVAKASHQQITTLA